MELEECNRRRFRVEQNELEMKLRWRCGFEVVFCGDMVLRSNEKVEEVVMLAIVLHYGLALKVAPGELRGLLAWLRPTVQHIKQRLLTG